ncbi:uncharacterized protein AMSG_09433 [Thecamonas trahens ATCC 50062]|uniref:Uncharacterized protein n=1 Tax=Thecamonas trahens ATCC 50062 TaxID=461836 RepID=A0A0L0DNZ6_THETB|nr:hypothetical protein AMSG_09433 [Thecamonas trahens ATCC 50062]KNC53128.1 hypothetical protein AMSG_09433 [Thecamonas trahens ATCC 50062]|eukprot:XP_013754795.1 hypothetical protein AMSG_09433 [Thecamonas trahens ATCC 50062]
MGATGIGGGWSPETESGDGYGPEPEFFSPLPRRRLTRSMLSSETGSDEEGRTGAAARAADMPRARARSGMRRAGRMSGLVVRERRRTLRRTNPEARVNIPHYAPVPLKEEYGLQGRLPVGLDSPHHPLFGSRKAADAGSLGVTPVVPRSYAPRNRVALERKQRARARAAFGGFGSECFDVDSVHSTPSRSAQPGSSLSSSCSPGFVLPIRNIVADGADCSFVTGLRRSNS